MIIYFQSILKVKAMTTLRNKFKKVAVKICLVAIFISPFAELEAQKALKSYDFKNTTNKLLKRSTEEILKAFNAKSDFFYEEEIPFEDWMMDLEKFGKSLDSSDLKKSEYDDVLKKVSMELIEEDLQLESWMTESDWSYKSSDFLVEDEIQLEDWMSKPRSW